MSAAGEQPILTMAEFEERARTVLVENSREASSTEGAIDGMAMLREDLARFVLPVWLKGGLEILDGWFLTRAASDRMFAYVAPAPDDLVDEFEREAADALRRLFDRMTELEAMCTATAEPVGAFCFLQLHNCAGILLRGEVAAWDQVGPAIGTPEEISDLDRLARGKAVERIVQQHDQLAEYL